MDKTVKDLQGQGIKAAGVAAHVGDRKQLEVLVKFAVDIYGRIDVLVSNAAVNPMAGDIMDMPDAVIDKVLAINIKAAIQLAQLARPHLHRVRPSVQATCRSPVRLLTWTCLTGQQHRIHLILHRVRACGPHRAVRSQQDSAAGPHASAG